MPDTRSRHATARLALRVALAFAVALTAAEAADLELTFIAPLVAVALALRPGPPLGVVAALPVLAWTMIAAVAILLQAFGAAAPLAYVVVTVGGLWAGYWMSTRPELAAPSLLTLIVFAIGPLRLMAYPEAAGAAADDVARNVLAGAATVWFLGLFLPAPKDPDGRPVLFEPIPPLGAALITTLAAYLVWVFEPPASGAVLIGVIITLRADMSPGIPVARDRFIAALIGGGAAVGVATLIELAPVLPMLFFALLAFSWPLALRMAKGGPWRRASEKALNAMGILTAEGFSPLFENTEERLWIRIAGVTVGLGFALLALRLVAPRRADPALALAVDDLASS